MASKKPAAKSAVPGAASAPKKPRKAKTPSMTQAQKYDLLTYVKQADYALPDASVAEAASARFNRKVLASSVRQYRKQFGIASVAKPTIGQLMAYIATLTATMNGNGIAVPPMNATAANPALAGDGGSTELQAA